MKPKYKVFISYSRKDEELIAPLIALLRLSGKKVFRDVDEIKPGQEWAKEIERALRECETFVLFWCCHSARSEWVAREIESALKWPKKRFIPVLLCKMPVPKPVSDYQWIDFRKTIQHACDVYEPHGSREWSGVFSHLFRPEMRRLSIPSQPLKSPPLYDRNLWDRTVTDAVRPSGVFFGRLKSMALCSGAYLGTVYLLLRLMEILLPDTFSPSGVIQALVFILFASGLLASMVVGFKLGVPPQYYEDVKSLLSCSNRSSRRIAAAVNNLIEGGYSSEQKVLPPSGASGDEV